MALISMIPSQTSGGVILMPRGLGPEKMAI